MIVDTIFYCAQIGQLSSIVRNMSNVNVSTKFNPTFADSLTSGETATFFTSLKRSLTLKWHSNVFEYIARRALRIQFSLRIRREELFNNR